MNIILFVLSNFFVLSTVEMLSGMWFEKQERCLRLLALSVLFSIEVTLLELIAGLAGHLTALTMTCAAAIVFLATGCIRIFISGWKPAGWFSQRRLLILFALLFAGVGVGVLFGQYITHGTHFCQDDLTYHATVTAHWYLEKDISAGPMNYHYYVPMNAELLCLWFLLPFGQDGAVFLAGYYWLCVTVAAAAVLFKRMNISLKWLGLLTLCCCCSKAVYSQSFQTFSAVDLAGPVMVISAIAFAACIPTQQARKRWPCVLLAGLCSGFAVGTKVPFATVCLFLCIWLFFSLPGRFYIRLAYVFLFGLAALLAGSFWYIRDLILTGNPVFPGQLGPLGGPITRDIQYQTSVIGRLVLSGFNRDIIWEMIIAHVSWPYGIFLVSFAGIAAGISRIRKPSGNRRPIILILIAVFVMIATYVHMPFSAANNVPGSSLIINLRFIIGPFLLGLILFFLLLETKVRYRIAWLIVCFAGVLISYIRHSNSTMLPLLAVAFLWYCIYPFLQKRERFISLPRICILITAILAGFAVVYPSIQKKADDNLWAYYTLREGVPEAWQKVNALPPASRIIVSGIQGYCYYPLFGRHYQNRPWYYTSEYESQVPLHVRWKDNPENCIFWKPSRFSREAWIQTISSLGIEYVLFYRSLKDTWPETQTVLSQLSIAEMVDSGENWTLWKIKK